MSLRLTYAIYSILYLHTSPPGAKTKNKQPGVSTTSASPDRGKNKQMGRRCNLYTPSSVFVSVFPAMAGKKATAEEWLARANANGYRRGAHREKDSIGDANRHVDEESR
jgi:hypothetical protein